MKVAHVGADITKRVFAGRNDAIANVAIVGAGVATASTLSPWPDMIVGLGIFAMNLDAAREVFRAARAEHAQAWA